MKFLNSNYYSYLIYAGWTIANYVNAPAYVTYLYYLLLLIALAGLLNFVIRDIFNRPDIKISGMAFNQILSARVGIPNIICVLMQHPDWMFNLKLISTT